MHVCDLIQDQVPGADEHLWINTQTCRHAHMLLNARAPQRTRFLLKVPTNYEKA